MVSKPVKLLGNNSLGWLVDQIIGRFVAKRSGYDLMSDAERDHLAELETPVDALSSNSVTAPLSANQGSVLSGMIATLGTDLADDLDERGIPASGAAQEILVKQSGTDYDVAWAGISDVGLSGDYDDILNLPTLPTNVSDLTNDVNYQTASEVASSIATAIGAITSIDYSFVSSLPASGVKGTIYFVPDTTDPTQRIEYVWDEGNVVWEEIGRPHIDLTDYVTVNDIDTITEAEIDALFGGSPPVVP